MSIVTLRNKLTGVPGAGQVMMKYEDGGRTAVYFLGQTEYRFPAELSEEAVAAAIIEASRE